MLGGCPDCVVLILKGFPKGVLQLPSPEVFKPQVEKALTAGSEPRALSRTWDWALSELPQHLSLLALPQVTPMPHSLMVLL